MSPTRTEHADHDQRRAEFERVTQYVTQRAWTEGLEEEATAALFDVLEEGKAER
jgi:hypothetical protein